MPTAYNAISMKPLSLIFCLFLLCQAYSAVSAQRVLFCYFGSWAETREGYAKFQPSDIDPFLCTHILFAFAGVNAETSSLEPLGSNDINLYPQTTNLKFANPSLKVLLSVGGFNHGTARFETVAANNASIDAFARSAITLLRLYNFDGLDVDWEWPDTSTRLLYQTFLQRLRAAFDTEAAITGIDRLLLTTAGNPQPERYGVADIAPYLDYFLFMAYDFFGVWLSQLAHHSPLYDNSGRLNMDTSVKLFLTSGLPKNKLVLGFATYGKSVGLLSAQQKNFGDLYTRQPASAGRFTNEPGTLAYYEICEKKREGWTTEFIDEAQVPIAYSSSELEWVCYDEPLSFTTKAEYVVTQDLAGAMVWSLDLDDFSSEGCRLGRYPLVSAIRTVFDRGATAPVTTTTTTTPVTTTTTPSVSTTTTSVRTTTTPSVTTTTTPSVTTTTTPSVTTTLTPSVTTTTTPSVTTTTTPSVTTTTTPAVTTTTTSETTTTTPSVTTTLSSSSTSSSSPTTPVTTSTTTTTTSVSPTTPSSATSSTITTAAAALTTTTTQGTQNTDPLVVYKGGLSCPTTWGIYAHPDDCDRFVICFWGSAYEFTCRPDRHFSDVYKVCVWPQGCDKG